MKTIAALAAFAIVALACGCAGIENRADPELAAKERGVNGGVVDHFVREKRARNRMKIPD